MKIHKILFAVGILLTATTAVKAQSYTAQKNSVGFSLGSLGYSGRLAVDAPLMNHTSFFGSFNYRRKLMDNLYIRAEALGGQLKGNNMKVESQYQKPQGEFTAGIAELSVKAEYDFINLNAHKVTPFANVGAAAYLLFGYSSTLGTKEGSDLMGFALPVGIGVKYKVNNRVKLLLEGNGRVLSGNLDGRSGENINNPNRYYNIGIGFIYELQKVNTLW